MINGLRSLLEVCSTVFSNMQQAVRQGSTSLMVDAFQAIAKGLRYRFGHTLARGTRQLLRQPVRFPTLYKAHWRNRFMRSFLGLIQRNRSVPFFPQDRLHHNICNGVMRMRL